MKAAINRVRERRRTVIDAAMVFVVILLVTQMWLLTATLESTWRDTPTALPGMLVSAVLFTGSLSLYRSVRSTDKTPGA
ncbi:MAG: DUF6755 family protein [Bryobacteraceae bacterium]